MYELDRRTDYAPLLRYAASLGICVLVPLTSRSGPGVLSRTDAAPKCYMYPAELYGYGATCLDGYWDHPNVVAGVVGNEVMNDLDSWEAAPCVRAYLDDLTRYMYGRYKAAMACKHSGGERGRDYDSGTAITTGWRRTEPS